MAIETRFGAPKGVQNLSNTSAQAIGSSRDAQRTERNSYNDIADAFNGVSQVIGQGVKTFIGMENTTKTVEANQAKQDYINIVTSDGYVEATGTNKAGMLEEFSSTLGDRSEAYQNAYIGYSAAETSRAKKAEHREYITSEVNSAGSGFTSWIDGNSGVTIEGEEDILVTNRALGKTGADYINFLVENNPALNDSKVELGQALLNDSYIQVVAGIQSATNEEELTAAMQDKVDIESTMKSPFLLNSKQSEAIRANSGRQRQIVAAQKLKLAEFKNQAYGRLSVNVKNGYRGVDLVQAKKDVEKTASNPLAASKQYKGLLDKVEERYNADAYNSTYAIGSRGGLMNKDNKLLMDERQEAVTTGLVGLFTENQPEEFTRIASNETGMTKEVGDAILTQINATDNPKQLGVLLERLEGINQQPKGATVLRQMFSDDEYTRIMSMKYMAQARPDQSMTQIRDYIDQTAQAVSSIKLDPNSNAEVLEYAVDLGTQADAYVNVMNNLLKINPQLAKAEYKNIAKQFSNQVSTDSDSGVKESKAMGENPADNLDLVFPDRVRQVIMRDVGKLGGNVDWMPGNIAVIKDSFSGTVEIRDFTSQIQDIELEETEKLLKDKAQEQKDIKTDPLVGAKVATKAFTRTLIDNVGGFVMNTPGVLGDLGGTLIDRFQDHLFNSMTSGQQEFLKGWKPNQDKDTSSELTLDLMEEYIKRTPTELPGVQNLTLDPVTKSLLPWVLEANKVKALNAKEISEEIKATRNVRNNNLGNIKLMASNKWIGQNNKGTTATFTHFNTPEQGVRALTRVVQKNLAATDSYETYVNRYASEPSEQEHFNNTGTLMPHLQNYADVLAKSQGITDTKSKPTKVNMLEWIKATATAEGGGKSLEYFTDDIITKGIKMEQGE